MRVPPHVCTYQEILYDDRHTHTEYNVDNVTYPGVGQGLIFEHCVRVFHLTKNQHEGCEKRVWKVIKQVLCCLIRFLQVDK